MPDRPDYFRCPVCKSVSFQHVRVPRANGTLYVTAFFSCTVCTTVFLDPVAFTRGYEDRPRNTPRAPAEPNAYQQWAAINQRRRERD